MLLIAIILLMIAVVIVIWRFAFASDSVTGHVKSHAKRIEGIRKVTDGTRTDLIQSKLRQTGATRRISQDEPTEDVDESEYNDDYYSGPGTYVQKAVSVAEPTPKGYYNSFGLPPIITVASGLAAVVIVVALVAAFILFISPSGTKKQNSSVTTMTTITNTNPKIVSTTSTTSLSAIQPNSVTSSVVVYSAPQGKYQLNISVTKASWVEVTENPNTSNSTNIVGQTMAAGTNQSVTVTGPTNLILGNTGATVTVNGVPLSFPQGNSYGTFEFR